jgi:F0F1-type ATP synthase delta subunit
MIAAQYAKALYELKPTKTHLRNLRAVLERRHHEKLLPQIFAEYQKLHLAEKRRAARAVVSKAGERTRVLLELYKKLVASK